MALLVAMVLMEVILMEGMDNICRSREVLIEVLIRVMEAMEDMLD